MYHSYVSVAYFIKAEQCNTVVCVACLIMAEQCNTVMCAWPA